MPQRDESLKKYFCLTCYNKCVIKTHAIEIPRNCPLDGIATTWFRSTNQSNIESKEIVS